MGRKTPQKQSNLEEYDIKDLKRYMKLSAKEKLNYLEDVNIFLNKAMTAESKNIWEKLKRSGW